MGDNPAITPAHALGTNRTVRVFHSGQSPRPHWWPSWEGPEVFFSSAGVRVMSGVVLTEEKTAGWVSKTWDPALCPVPSLLVTPICDPQFLHSLLKCAAPGLGCAALSSLSDEGHPLSPEDMALVPGLQTLSQKPSARPVVSAAGPRARAGTVGVSATCGHRWLSLCLVPYLVTSPWILSTPPPGALPPTHSGEAASDSCSRSQGLVQTPARSLAWTPASALGPSSPGSGPPSWEAVSGPERKLSCPWGQNWVRFPSRSQGGVSGVGLGLAALNPEAAALIPHAQPHLPAGGPWGPGPKPWLQHCRPPAVGAWARSVLL